jgi:hypothetical protein
MAGQKGIYEILLSKTYRFAYVKSAIKPGINVIEPKKEAKRTPMNILFFPR